MVPFLTNTMHVFKQAAFKSNVCQKVEICHDVWVDTGFYIIKNSTHSNKIFTDFYGKFYEHLNIKKERNVLNDSIDSRKKLLKVLNDMFKMFSYTTKFKTFLLNFVW